MSKRMQDNIVALVLLAIFCGFLYLSFNYSPKARLVPVPIATASIILILVQLYIQNFARNFDLHVDPSKLFKTSNAEAAISSTETKKTTVKKQGGGKEIVGLGVVLLFLALVLLIGILPGVFLFIVGYMILIGKQKWYKALIYTTICEVVIYLLFVMMLKVQMYEGLLLILFQS